MTCIYYHKSGPLICTFKYLTLKSITSLAGQYNLFNFLHFFPPLPSSSLSSLPSQTLKLRLQEDEELSSITWDGPASKSKASSLYSVLTYPGNLTPGLLISDSWKSFFPLPPLFVWLFRDLKLSFGLSHTLRNLIKLVF